MRNRIAVIGVLLLLLLAACQPAAEPAVAEPAEAAHNEAGEPPHWSYEGADGPAYWGDLGDEYATCKSGTSQSPINIVNAVAGNQTDIAFDYGESALTILNNGHTVQVQYDPGSVAVIDGTPYKLLQFHFHTPSEHAVNDELYAAEMHLVHADAYKNLAVVGIFIKEGAANPAFADIVDNVPAQKTAAATIAGLTVDINDMLPAVTTTFRYSGSLTTPPCSENVAWNVVETPIEMSAAQIATLHEAMHSNNRPLQDINGRDLIGDGPDG